MDPNEALRRVTRAMRAGDLDHDAMASYDGYVEWTGKGGFLADDDVRADFIEAFVDWDTSHPEGAGFHDTYRDYLEAS
jgi:hypothetical protein